MAKNMRWTRNRLMTCVTAAGLAAAISVGCSKEEDPVVAGGGSGGGTPASGGIGGAAGGAGMPGAPMEINADIIKDTTWPVGTYVLKKKIYVIGPAKLTIAAGSQIWGDADVADKPALIVARGAQLVAKGTKDSPIVFTSSAAAGAKRGGDWAGVALLGSARINSGLPCPSGAPGCKESGIEGIPATELRAKFGGTDDAGSCGTLEYIRVEFAGAELEPNRELNGLTFGGCGSGTKVSYVQIHRGTDDGIEVFGGTVSMDHIVLSGNEDDSLDWDYGWTGKVQFLVIHQRAAIGDYGFEGAGSPQGETLEPRSAPTIYNATLVGRPDGGKAMHLKEGTRGIMRNLLIQSWQADVIRFTAKEVDLAMEWPMHLAIEDSLFWMNGKYSTETVGMPTDDDKGFDDQGAVENAARRNKLDVDPMLTSINDLTGGAAPNYVPRNAALGMGGATPPAGFDASATYYGAFKPNDSAPWTAGWTAYPKD